MEEENCHRTTHRARLLAILRVQFPDTLAEEGFKLLHPTSGETYGDHDRHLVATCRSVANFALGAIVDGPDWCVDAVEHGLSFLEEKHHAGEGYHLLVDADGTPRDRTRSAYGHAFVLLAYARATEAGVDDAKDGLAATHELIENRFRDDTGLLRSDCHSDWTEQEPYRGQNANMHACEAYIAAYDVTGNDEYLDRARHIARSITVDLASETGGLLWEHYTDNWTHNYEYNDDKPRHQFRPPGYQPGHHVEWAKLLALLDRYDDTVGTDTGGDTDTPNDGWYSRARELFEAAVNNGWTGNGFVYTHEADGTPIVTDQYGWVLAEALAASAVLSERAARYDDEAVDRFQEWNRRFLACTDRYRGPAGVWYEKRLPADDENNVVAPDPPGVEPDYHPATAFYECWRSTQRRCSDKDEE